MYTLLRKAVHSSNFEDSFRCALWVWENVSKTVYGPVASVALRSLNR